MHNTEISDDKIQIEMTVTVSINYEALSSVKLLELIANATAELKTRE